MLQSTTIIAFDQHEGDDRAVLLSGHRTPALHSLTSDSPTILRFVQRLRRQGAVICCAELSIQRQSCQFETHSHFLSSYPP
jgi:hypothetical protein